MTRPDIDAIRARLDGYPNREQLVTLFSNFGEYPNQDANMYAAMLSSQLVPPVYIEDLLNYIEELEELHKVEQVSRVKKLLEAWELTRIFSLYTSGVEPKRLLLEINQQLSQALEGK